MRTNVKLAHPHGRTHEGAPAAPMNTEQALRRSVMSCLLWENEFYEDGVQIGYRIMSLCKGLPVQTVANIAIEARHQGYLRHVPLLLLAYVIKHGKGKPVADAIEAVITRSDELTELMAMHAAANGVQLDGVRPYKDNIRHIMSAQMKKGIGRAFAKFDEYQLSKYNSNTAIKLKDMLILSHAKPQDEAQAALWKRLLKGELAVPDTWEIALTTGADKKETFERLITEGKLGYSALLRNLRNMAKAGCDETLVKDAIIARKGARYVLPFRYIAAARAVPQWEPAIDEALSAAIDYLPVLPGKTNILVDVSQSMEKPLSDKSDLTRLDAAAALASIIPGDVRVFTFSQTLVGVPPRRGMAGVDAIRDSQAHAGTYLGMAVAEMNRMSPDRLIVITDEESHDPVPSPTMKRAYMINVASAQRGVGYGGNWLHMDGFSENVLRFIAEYEGRTDVKSWNSPLC